MNKDLTVGKPQTVLWKFCMPLFRFFRYVDLSLSRTCFKNPVKRAINSESGPLLQKEFPFRFLDISINLLYGFTYHRVKNRRASNRENLTNPLLNWEDVTNPLLNRQKSTKKEGRQYFVLSALFQKSSFEDYGTYYDVFLNVI